MAREWCQDYDQNRGFLRCVFEDHEFAYWVQGDANFDWSAGYGDEVLGKFSNPVAAIRRVELEICRNERRFKPTAKEGLSRAE